MSVETLEQKIARLESENAKLKAAKASNGMKITPKGGLSVYGLQRFPVTLYRAQWVKLIDMVPTIKAFIEANQDKLTDKAKPESEAVVA